MLRQVALGVLLCLLPVAGPAAGVSEPDGYRMDDYRAPVPTTLAGATVIDTDTAALMWEGGEAAFIDVMPRPPKPANLPEGTVWRDQPRDSIPGCAVAAECRLRRIGRGDDGVFPGGAGDGHRR